MLVFPVEIGDDYRNFLVLVLQEPLQNHRSWHMRWKLSLRHIQPPHSEVFCSVLLVCFSPVWLAMKSYLSQGQAQYQWGSVNTAGDMAVVEDVIILLQGRVETVMQSTTGDSSLCSTRVKHFMVSESVSQCLAGFFLNCSKERMRKHLWKAEAKHLLAKFSLVLRLSDDGLFPLVSYCILNSMIGLDLLI